MKKLLLVACFGAVTMFAADGATLYKPCIACHGAKGEKVALGKGKVIKGWPVEQITQALNGYKKGTYGGPMKGVMKGQVVKLSDADIKAVAEHINSFK